MTGSDESLEIFLSILFFFYNRGRNNAPASFPSIINEKDRHPVSTQRLPPGSFSLSIPSIRINKSVSLMTGGESIQALNTGLS